MSGSRRRRGLDVPEGARLQPCRTSPLGLSSLASFSPRGICFPGTFAPLSSKAPILIITRACVPRCSAERRHFATLPIKERACKPAPFRPNSSGQDARVLPRRLPARRRPRKRRTHLRLRHRALLRLRRRQVRVASLVGRAQRRPPRARRRAEIPRAASQRAALRPVATHRPGDLRRPRSTHSHRTCAPSAAVTGKSSSACCCANIPDGSSTPSAAAPTWNTPAARFTLAACCAWASRRLRSSASMPTKLSPPSTPLSPSAFSGWIASASNSPGAPTSKA